MPPPAHVSTVVASPPAAAEQDVEAKEEEERRQLAAGNAEHAKKRADALRSIKPLSCIRSARAERIRGVSAPATAETPESSVLPTVTNG